VPGRDRTPKIIEQEAPVDDRRFLLLSGWN
jgi:hypothetical protein